MEHKQHIAFHEAGHAAGIHLNNKLKGLPPVFFKIVFKDISDLIEIEGMDYQAVQDECIARVEGGRLIEFIPNSFHSDSVLEKLSEDNDKKLQLIGNYKSAFEADIINLLIGPLAEAKYVADIDGELFNHKLITLEALKNYGGSSDIALANEYLQSLSPDKHEQDGKLAELFSIAYNFIDNAENWSAITHLAEYILGSCKHIIYCEEVITILDKSVAHFKNRNAGSPLKINAGGIFDNVQRPMSHY
ncbi:MAG: hypothetical protein U1D70_11350 [Methylobacter sp.]|nr:hypothetical protein [Methylobacter sp.]